LGRREDLLRIDNINIVDVFHFETEESQTLQKYDAYVPAHLIDDEFIGYKSTVYTLNKVYKKVEIKRGTIIRQWDRVRVYHAAAGKLTFIEDIELVQDNEGDLVFLA
jgi:CRISPR-associated protein Cas5t